MAFNAFLYIYCAIAIDIFGYNSELQYQWEMWPCCLLIMTISSSHVVATILVQQYSFQNKMDESEHQCTVHSAQPVRDFNHKPTVTRDIRVYCTVSFLRLSERHYKKTPLATRTETTCSVQRHGNKRIFYSSGQRHTIFLCCDKNPAIKKDFVTKE